MTRRVSPRRPARMPTVQADLLRMSKLSSHCFPMRCKNELITTTLGWLKALYDAGYPLWTSMFLGINSDKYFLWEPSYEADFGPWRVDLEGDNWPTVAAGLRKMGTDTQ